MSKPVIKTGEPTCDDRLFNRIGIAFRGIVPFGRRYRSLFLRGAIAAIGLVAARLALPWPLRSIADMVTATADTTGLTAAAGGQIITLLGLFLLAVTALGLFDYLTRLCFSRFAIATTRDLRQTAFVATLGIDATSRKAATGDLVSRLIGDSARLKAGVQGFLIHVASNGLLFVGITVVLFTIEPFMGVLFFLAAIVTGLVTAWGAQRIFQVSLQHRHKEGQLANKIHSSLRKTHQQSKLKRINKASGRYEASVTRLQGQVTWAAHVVFGLAVAGSLWVGYQSASAGAMTIGDLVLFMFYALMARGPIVRLARQGTRSGKILGPAYRLVQMLEPPTMTGGIEPAFRLRSLKKKLILTGVRVEESPSGPFDLVLTRGERVAIVDTGGDSLRPLLEVMAGRNNRCEGTLTWDSAVLRNRNLRALRAQVALFTPEPPAAGAQSALAQRFRQIAVHGRRRASVWLYLEPDSGLSPDDASAVLASLSASQEDSPQTTVVTTRCQHGLDGFDRIVEVKDGRIVFDGIFNDWRGPQRMEATNILPMRVKSSTSPDKFRILFSGYAPVHFRCFQPLYQRLKDRPDVEIRLSGGLRSGDKGNYAYDSAALYEGFDLPSESVLPVEKIRDMDFDLMFSAHTKLIAPRQVGRRIQIFHGVSFRNKAIRPENMACDHYFVIGPYMLSRFVGSGLMQETDSRVIQVGFMKTDALVNGTLERKSILRSMGFDGSRPVVLYAPTGARENSLETIGEDAIRKLVATDKYDLLIKPHDHPKNKEIDWAEYLQRYEGEHCHVVPPREDVIPMLFIADLLISDASSVVNEYTLLDRPIVFLDTPELLEQARAARHSMLDLSSFGRTGGVVAGSATEVPGIVAQSLADPGQLSSERRRIADSLFFNKGNATDIAMAWMEQNLLPSGNLTKEKRNASDAI